MPRPQNQWIFAVLMIVAGLSMAGCGEGYSPSDEDSAAAADRGFLAGADNEAIRQALRYSCPANAGGSTSSSFGGTTDYIQSMRSCLRKGLKTKSIVLQVPWNCSQSDTAKFKRTLPVKATLKIPSTFSVSSGVFSGESIEPKFDFTELEAFFAPIINGDTDYSACVSSFDSAAREELIKQMGTKILSECGETDASMVGGISASDISRKTLSILESSRLASKGTLIPALIPFFESAQLASDVASNDQCPPGTIPGMKAVEQKPSASKTFVTGKLKSLIDRKSSCGEAALAMLDATKLWPQGCNAAIAEKTSASARCLELSARLRELYSALDEQFPKAKIVRKSFSQMYADVTTSKFTSELTSKDFSATTKGLIPDGSFCDELAVGETRFADTKRVGRPYLLTRTSEKSFDLAINVKFMPACSLDENANGALVNGWMRKVTQCLELAAPHLRDAQGRLIHIKVVSKTEDEATTPNYITVLGSDEKIRASSGMYSSVTKCSTIIHEVLHLTGLVDEYKETEGEIKLLDGSMYKLKNACRKPGPDDSIMSMHWLAIINTDRTGASLLKPAHSRFLLYPRCASKTATYYACAAGAYEGETAASCPVSMPSECSGGSVDWINK